MGRRAHRLTEARSIATFRNWLAAAGAEVQAVKSSYEVVRFFGPCGLSIIYRNDRGRSHKMTGDAQAAWEAFVRGAALDLTPPPPACIADPARRVPAMSDADLLTRAAREPVTIAFLMQHDALPMREAAVRLFGLERAGRLVRFGGDRRDPLRWSPASLPDLPEVTHA